MADVQDGARSVPGPRLRRARSAVFTAFLLNGLVLAVWIVNVPAVVAATDVSNATLGTTLLALGAGSVVAMQAAGLAAARLGSRPAVATGAVLLAAGAVLIGMADDVTGLVLALLVLGAGNGAIDVAMNDQAVQVQRAYGRPIMSAFHAFFSVGGAIGAGAGALLQARDVGHATALELTAGVAVVLGAVATAGLLPASEREPGPEPGSAPPSASAAPRPKPDRSHRPFDPRGRALVLGALAFAFMLAEGMVNDWSALHAEQHLGQAASLASLAYLVFAITMTAGRLLVDRVVERVGPVTVVRVGSVIAAAGLGLVVASPAYALTLVGWVVFGLGLSGIVPQLFTAAGALAGGPGGAITLSRIVSAGYVGMLAGPAVIGWISSATSINAALLLPLVLVVTGAFAAGAVREDRPAAARPA